MDYPHIVSTPNVMGGKPRLDGHRISVQNIVIWHEQMGYTIPEIASMYDLSLAQVHSALAYYFDHKQEIDDSIRQEDAFVAQLKQQTPSLLGQKLYERAH